MQTKEKTANSKLYRKVAHDLEMRILAGDFEQLGRLPSERNLADALGVSRATMREALIALEVRGLVEVRGGSGIFLTGMPLGEQLLPAVVNAGAAWRDVLEVRIWHESESAAGAARLGDQDQHAQIRQAVKQGWRDFEKLGTQKEDRLDDDADGLFHTAIARASQNHFNVLLVRQFWQLMRAPVVYALENRVQMAQHAELALYDHEQILMAIEKREAEAAAAAMRKHLSRYMNLLGLS